MNRRVFFLACDGWFETEISGRLVNASVDELIGWAYTAMEKHNYRNYMIKEGPG